jgi:cell division protein FtsQ
MSPAPAPGRVVTDPRLSRRRAAVARMRRRRAVTTVAAVLAVGAGAWLAFGSPLLTARTLQVVGGRHTGSGEIRKAAGLSGEENLLLLSTEEVARAAAELPWVARAEVDRKLPDTVRVAVVERAPAAAVAADSGRWLVSARGHVLARGSGGGLPVVADSDLRALRAGAQVDDAEVEAALRVLRALPGGVGRRVEAVFAPTRERITLSLGGVLVRMGAAEQLRAKVEVLRALLRRIGTEGTTPAYVDVRVPGSPALGPSVRG